MSGERTILTVVIEPEREGAYFTVPFTLPPDVESLTLKYSYVRHDSLKTDVQAGSFTAQPEINIIDLGLIAPDGTQVGVSGSDKCEITISETFATPGYHPCRLTAGEWGILVGAYKVAPGGVRVEYEINFTFKTLRWLKGDLHTHTVGSDGVLTAEELGWHALRHGLDFLAITDHNQMISADSLPRIPGLTIIPGVEWTHYQGHANFTGVDRPYDGSFMANTLEEVQAHFQSARERGALITINHPFEEVCPFKFEFKQLPFDCIEIWNGPMREANLRSLWMWHSLLVEGRKIAACGGSDYHRSTPFLFLGGPTTCVWAKSNGASDILDALRAGHAYIVFAPNGPTLNFGIDETVTPGDSVSWAEVQSVNIDLTGLQAGDAVQVVTANGAEQLLQCSGPGDFHGSYHMPARGFARVEVWRAFLPGLPLLPALISNPIYFD